LCFPLHSDTPLSICLWIRFPSLAGSFSSHLRVSASGKPVIYRLCRVTGQVSLVVRSLAKVIKESIRLGLSNLRAGVPTITGSVACAMCFIVQEHWFGQDGLLHFWDYNFRIFLVDHLKGGTAGAYGTYGLWCVLVVMGVDFHRSACLLSCGTRRYSRQTWFCCPI